jgi:hypothetical protein
MKGWDIRQFLAKLDLLWNIIDTNTIRMEKYIRDKNINLHGLHIYFSTVEGLIWENIFF